MKESNDLRMAAVLYSMHVLRGFDILHLLITTSLLSLFTFHQVCDCDYYYLCPSLDFTNKTCHHLLQRSS